MTTSSVSLNYGSHILRGDVFLTRKGNVFVDLLDWPLALTMDAARGALRSAVRDGRCKVPDPIRAAIDNGAKVL